MGDNEIRIGRDGAIGDRVTECEDTRTAWQSKSRQYNVVRKESQVGRTMSNI